jgi:SAM-dependent methyltransferase
MDGLEALGLTTVDVARDGQILGSRISADPTGATEVPGVWVAGAATDVTAQVIGAAAAGLTAGAAINADLVGEDTRAAVDEYRRRTHGMFDRDAWEQRYRAHPAMWSGKPNAQLVAEASDLRPGRALDVGCGEGADAVWLAERGWQVIAVDIATAALDRAATHAARAGADVAARIMWTHADLRAEPPAESAYDLVSAQYMQLPSGARRALFARLAAAVAPGGTLLIVGHHPSDHHATHQHFPDKFYTAQDIAAALGRTEWRIVAAETRVRAAHDGESRDAVLVARRRERADSWTVRW